MNVPLQFTVFDEAAALRDWHLQSNLLGAQDFIRSGCKLQYILTSQTMVLHLCLHCDKFWFTRRGACDFKSKVAHLIFCYYLQQFVRVMDFILFFTMVFDVFCIYIIIYNALIALSMKLLLFTITSHPILTGS